MMTTLVWKRTTYSDGHREHPAVYVRWEDVTAYLGRPYEGDPEQDECLVHGLLESGAPAWVQDAPGWIDEHGWGLYRADREGNGKEDDKMTKEEKVKKFIEGLNNVAAETGIFIVGCGCHDSPFLATNSTIQYYKDNGIKKMGDGQLYFDVEEMTYKLKSDLTTSRN